MTAPVHSGMQSQMKLYALLVSLKCPHWTHTEKSQALCHRLFVTGHLSDLTITCRGEKFPVHKVILYLRSEYFRKLLGGPFKEAGAEIIDLPDDDPYALRVLVRYFYNNVLDTSFSRARARGDRQSDSAFLVRVYAIADKYDVPTLRSLAVSRLDSICDQAKDEADFIDALRVVDECTAENTIWDLLVPKLKANLQALLENEMFQEVVAEQPVIALNILRSFASSSSTPVREAPRRGARARPEEGTYALSWKRFKKCP